MTYIYFYNTEILIFKFYPGTCVNLTHLCHLLPFVIKIYFYIYLSCNEESSLTRWPLLTGIDL